MNIAIIHDFLYQYGGAERVLEVIHEIFPSAPIYTSVYNSKNLPEKFKKMNIISSFLNYFPSKGDLRRYLFLYPVVFKQINLSKYDVILSCSSAFAKWINKHNHQLHICYCYTPMRFAWEYDKYIHQEKLPWFIKKILPKILFWFKAMDLKSNKKVDHFIAISQNVRNKIKNFYGLDSKVIYPPVDTDFFSPSSQRSDFFLVVSRLVGYKRVDIAIEAFNYLGLPLKIIGEGPQKVYLEKTAKANIEFLGKISDEQLLKYYQQCRALIFTGEEDFGLTPLEANACGRPVIAYRSGGALETIIENKTGLFFEEQTKECLIQSIYTFLKKENLFDSKLIRKYAKSFSKDNFKKKIFSFIKEKYHC